jgi:glucose/mannose-6-phosphate isomerase
MLNLDDEWAIRKTQGDEAVLKSVNNFPQQLNQAFNESCKIEFPQSYRVVKNIVVCGMGGSRFTPLIVKELFKNEIKVPYIINDDYLLPSFVDPETLVVLSSYSGTTEEIVRCGKTAFEKGAKLTGLSADGEIATFLKKKNLPVYIFNPIYNPSQQQRIGSGYMVGGHLGILAKLNLINVKSLVIKQAIKSCSALTKSYKISVVTKKNIAKILAKKLYNQYPYYIVSEFLTGVGNGIANQTNETAKTISSFRVVPELNHHLMEGLKFPSRHRSLATFVFFFSSLYSPQIKKRFYITKEVIEQNNIKTIWYELKGKNKIEQVFELMGLGSYITMYLAALYNQNPALIPYVDYFKKKLKEMK